MTFKVVASWLNPQALRFCEALVSGIFIMGMLWTSFPIVREDMVVFCVCWIAAAENLYWRIIVLESSNKIRIKNMYTSLNPDYALVKLNDGVW